MIIVTESHDSDVTSGSLSSVRELPVLQRGNYLRLGGDPLLYERYARSHLARVFWNAYRDIPNHFLSAEADLKELRNAYGYRDDTGHRLGLNEERWRRCRKEWLLLLMTRTLSRIVHWILEPF